MEMCHSRYIYCIRESNPSLQRARCPRRATLSLRTPGDVARRERGPRWRLERAPRKRALAKVGAKRTSRARRPLTTRRCGMAAGVAGASDRREKKRGGGAPRGGDAQRNARSVASARGRSGVARRPSRRSLRWRGPWQKKTPLAKRIDVHCAARASGVGGDGSLHTGGTENARPSRERARATERLRKKLCWAPRRQLPVSGCLFPVRDTFCSFFSFVDNVFQVGLFLGSRMQGLFIPRKRDTRRELWGYPKPAVCATQRRRTHVNVALFMYVLIPQLRTSNISCIFFLNPRGIAYVLGKYYLHPVPNEYGGVSESAVHISCY